MKDSENNNIKSALRLLPSVDSVFQNETARKISEEIGEKKVTDFARLAIDAVRAEILSNDDSANFSREDLLSKTENYLINLAESENRSKLQKVINATGVIIHTNLGRAPLSENAVEAMINETSRYCNLEYDLATGKRGRRGGRAEQLLAEITGAEDALIVNNCAAACILVLTALCKNGEAIVSRGELVEIGGDFRIPDVMEQSCAILREVGTTNRTKISDYKNAITENTRLLVKIHPSNYRIIGFTETPNVRELAELAHKNNILFYEDAGSGAIFDLSKYGLDDEPIIPESVAAGADVVTFSGDKLLGVLQAGLIVGRGDTIRTLRKHPLYRPLRVSKIVSSALEAALESFRRETAFEEIPILQMISMSADTLKKRTENFSKKLNGNLKYEIVKGFSVIGGGSAPNTKLETSLLSVRHENHSANQLEEILRNQKPPIIARISEEKLLIDLRTVSETEEADLLKTLSGI